MEQAYAPLMRQFSAIKGYQTAYTLVYSLDADAEHGCHLTLERKGAQARQASVFVPLDPEEGYQLLRYLCENVVQPELWEDVIADCLSMLAAASRGGTAGGQ